MIWSTRKQYYLGFLNVFATWIGVYLIKKNMLKQWVWSTRDMSWVISNMAASTTCDRNVHIFSLKEYKIITLIYNKKNMEVWFLRVRRCNSLSHPSLMLEYKYVYILFGQLDMLIQVKLFIYLFFWRSTITNYWMHSQKL